MYEYRKNSAPFAIVANRLSVREASFDSSL